MSTQFLVMAFPSANAMASRRLSESYAAAVECGVRNDLGQPVQVSPAAYGYVLPSDTNPDVLAAMFKAGGRLTRLAEQGGVDPKNKDDAKPHKGQPPQAKVDGGGDYSRTLPLKEGTWYQLPKRITAYEVTMAGSQPISYRKGSLKEGRYFVLGVDSKLGMATLSRRAGYDDHLYNIDLSSLAEEKSATTTTVQATRAVVESKRTNGKPATTLHQPRQVHLSEADQIIEGGHQRGLAIVKRLTEKVVEETKAAGTPEKKVEAPKQSPPTPAPESSDMDPVLEAQITALASSGGDTTLASQVAEQQMNEGMIGLSAMPLLGGVVGAQSTPTDSFEAEGEEKPAETPSGEETPSKETPDAEPSGNVTEQEGLIDLLKSRGYQNPEMLAKLWAEGRPAEEFFVVGGLGIQDAKRLKWELDAKYGKR